MQEPTQLLSGEGRRRWSIYERIGSIGPAGVVATACRHRGPDATREAPAGIAVGINWQLARARPGRLRTGRDGFPSSGSSTSNASLRETRFGYRKTQAVNPVMALGMK